MKPLILAIMVLGVLLSACAVSTSSTARYEHFGKSIDYGNQAATIQNKLPDYKVIAKEDMKAIVDLQRQSLIEAKLVDIDQLNGDYKEFGTHYRDEFIKGLELFLDAYDTIDSSKNVEALMLLDRWEGWYRQNIDGIRRAVQR